MTKINNREIIILKNRKWDGYYPGGEKRQASALRILKTGLENGYIYTPSEPDWLEVVSPEIAEKLPEKMREENTKAIQRNKTSLSQYNYRTKLYKQIKAEVENPKGNAFDLLEEVGNLGCIEWDTDYLEDV